MKHILALSFLFLSSMAFGDDWLCSEESSQRRGNSILACGIGEDVSEPKARSLALKAAKAEFKEICDASDDCLGHAIVVIPKRTSCKEGKCYRLVSFEIQPGLNTQAQAQEDLSDWRNPNSPNNPANELPYSMRGLPAQYKYADYNYQ